MLMVLDRLLWWIALRRRLAILLLRRRALTILLLGYRGSLVMLSSGRMWLVLGWRCWSRISRG